MGTSSLWAQRRENFPCGDGGESPPREVWGWETVGIREDGDGECGDLRGWGWRKKTPRGGEWGQRLGAF
jgi:hypothetical protein